MAERQPISSDGNELISHRFGPAINVREAESFIATLAAEDVPQSDIRLDFSACRHIDAGVAWRLGNALRRHSELGRQIAAVIPSESDLRRIQFQILLRSGLGMVLARRAHVVFGPSGVEVTDWFRKQYGVSGEQRGQNYCVRTDLHAGSTDVERPDSLMMRLEAWLDYVNSPRHLFDSFDRNTGSENARAPLVLQRSSFAALANLAFEAVQNVADHAAKAPLAAGSELVSYLALDYYKQFSTPSDAPGDLRGYYERTRQRLRRSKFPTLELRVVDDGVGVAARFSRNPQIYWASPQVERRALEDALSDGASVKLLTLDAPVRGDPGFGSTHMVRSLQRLSGYALLRTGRLVASCDGSLAGERGFELDSRTYGYMPGTALSILVPVPELQLSLLGL